MTNSQVDLLSRNKFITRNFAVVPELLGKATEFKFENRLIRIELPAENRLSESKKDNSPLHIVSYIKKDGIVKPKKIAVDSVDVLIHINEKVSLPDEALTRHPNPIDLLSNEQQRELNKLAKAYEDTAYRAFDLWVRTLRWKSDNGAIGRPEIHGAESGRHTYLLNGQTGLRFWAYKESLTLRTFGCITLVEWHEVEETLKRGEQPPVYIDLMFDGIEHFKLDDLQRSVVDLAVACEAFMRARVTQNLPDGITAPVLKYIDEAPIQRVLDKFFKEIWSDDQNMHLKSIRSTLHQLFDARNDILHYGHKEDLNSVDCKKYIEATKKLIAIG